ncbi:Periplasmic beta-glucosidase precursor, putative, partial [Ricinus communis]
MSDYFAIKEMISRHKLTDQLADTAVMAINAGVDVELPDGEAYVLLPQLVRSGRIPEAAVDAAVARVLKIKFEGGLFENPYADEKTAEAKTATPQAVALAREAARKAVVLLKNDKGLLPLDGKKIKRLALLGTHAKDTPIGGYSDEPRHVVSVLEGLTAEAKAQGFALDYAEAVRITEKRVWAADEVKLVDPAVNAKLIAEAVEVAKKADVVVMVLGDNEQTSREAWADNHLGDRDSLDLVGQQNDLARAIFALGKPTVVLLLNGRPLSVNLLAEKADAIVEGWYLGQETGNAAADVLFGRANPGGKLPVSIARDVGQLPIYYNRKPTARRGYLFDRATSPLYPFGFGLSYTSFEISAPRLSKARIGQGESTTVSVEVTNTGKVAGDE